MASTPAPLFLSVGEDLKLWDTKSVNSNVKHISSQRIPNVFSISEAAFSPRGDCLAVVGCSDAFSTVYVLDTTKKGFSGLQATDIFKTDQKSSSSTNLTSSREKISHTEVAFSGSASLIACGTADGQIDFFNRRTLKVTKTLPAVEGHLTALSYNFDDSVILAGYSNGNILIRSTSEASASFPARTNQKSVRRFRNVPFSNNTVCSGHSGGAVCLMDIQTGDIVRTFEEHLADCTDVTFSLVNPVAAVSVGLDSRIVFYDMREKKKLNSLTADASLTSALFLPSGSELLCGTSTGKILVYDLRRAGEPDKITAHTSSVTCLAVQPDRKERPTATENTISTAGYVVNAKKISPGYERRTATISGTGSEPSSSSSTASSLNRSTSIPKSRPANRPIPATSAKPGVGSAGLRLADPLSTITRRPSPPPPAPISQPLAKISEIGQGDVPFMMPAVPPSRLPLIKITANQEETAAEKENTSNGTFIMPKLSANSSVTVVAEPAGDARVQLDTVTKALYGIQDEVIQENKISCLEVQDVVHDYGSNIQQHLFDIKDEIKDIRAEMKGTTALLQVILTELRLLKNHMPY